MNIHFFYKLDFVLQFGIASESNETLKWKATIEDDPIGVQSNTAGTLSYATSGPNTRTTQLFINLNNNKDLDYQGFTPIGHVVSGFEILKTAIYNPTPGSSYGISQDDYTNNGNEWILQNYPNIDIITSTTLTEE